MFKKNKLFKSIFAIFIIVSMVSCETYPDFEMEYSETYPFNGKYFVKDYSLSDSLETENYYILYIYNKSYNDNGNAVWIDSRGGTSGLSFKVGNTVNFDANSFNGSSLKVYSNDVLSKEVTITNSKIELKEEAGSGADSIYFTVNVITYDTGTGLPIGEEDHVVKGHRRTGFEDGTGYGQDL